ncbi:MAG: type II toxin-antitoxin system VapC family toxin [Verrucomicrobiota bacterium]
MTPICLDSSAWIEITHDGANAKAFAQALSSPSAIIVSTISLYEIARYTLRVAGEIATEELVAFLHQHRITPVTPEIATLAATLGTRHKLAMADALIYATAQNQNATLWTQDVDFQGLPGVRYFPK